jgi:SOS-response transcriptional repressor LexA
MSMGLTPTQAKALAFVQRYLAEAGCGPTYDEICQHMGIASKAGAFRLMTALEQRGHIRRIPNRARAIEVVGLVEGLGDRTTEELRVIRDRIDSILRGRSS